MAELLKEVRYTSVLASCRGPYLHYADIHRSVPNSSRLKFSKEVTHSTPPYILRDYNLSAQSPKSSSQYHESCQPKKIPTLTSKPPLTQAELRKADVVSQDKVWKQAVGNEQKGLIKWENTWGYLTEYDSKGNPIEKSVLPDSYAQSEPGPVPVTNSGHYGSRITTEQGQTMLNLEFQLSKSNKKRKLDTEMICY